MRRKPCAPSACQDLHCGHALHGPDRETRAGRGAYDLGIVRVDRSRPEPESGRAGGRRAAHQRAGVAGIGETGADEHEARGRERGEPDAAAWRRRRTPPAACACRRCGRRRRAAARRRARRPAAPRSRSAACPPRTRDSTGAPRFERGRDDPRSFGDEHALFVACAPVAQQQPQPRDLRARRDFAARARLRRRRGPRARSRRAHRTSPARAPRGRRGSCGRRRPRPPSTPR